jgi:uncharacterized repeat protein (TIGR02543 family)
MKKKKSNVNRVTIISIIIVLLVMCLSIGWSSLNSIMHLGSISMVRINSDIRVTGFNHTTASNGGISEGEEYNVKSVSGALNLPNANSTITYKVEITNMQLPNNTYMGIKSMTGLPNNLKIVSITDYTLKDKICDSNDPTDCGSGSQKTFYITIGYKDNAYDSTNTHYGFNLDFEFKKVYDITYSGFTNPPVTPITVMDGDKPTINFNSDAQNILTVISGGNTLVMGNDYTYSNRVMTFITSITDHLYITNPSLYTITYELNGGVQANNQVTTYTSNENQTIKSPTKTDYIFGGWYLNSNFTGDDIRNTSQITGNVILYANWVNQKARVGNNYYATLAAAIQAVTNSDETTVELLANSSEKITIGSGRNIILDLKNNTLSNSGNNPVIANNGHLTIISGNITSSATQGAINNNQNATLNITGGTVTATGTRQALYNQGIANISGGTFTSSTSERGTIQNLAIGTLNITGGTITSTGMMGVDNVGTLRIGTKGHGVSVTSPSIKGETYGVVSTHAFTYYDGVIGGKTDAIDDETMISEIETAYEMKHTTNGSYKEVHLETIYVIVTFEYNGGVETEPTRGLTAGSQLGTLPTTSREGYTFVGWFDANDNEVSASKIINNNINIYAHWRRDTVARIGTEEYGTLPEALATVSDNTPTTITLLKDITLSNTISVTSAKNITFNLNGHTLEYAGGTTIENYGSVSVTDSAGGGSIIGGKLNGNTYIPAVNNKSGGSFTLSGGTILSNVSQVFENNGSFTMTGGKITIANIAQGVVNNNAGAVMNMSGGTIEAPIAGSKRQGIYNKGTVNISGTAVITSATSDRGVVQNDASSGTINISGGTITSTNTNCQKGAVHNDKGGTVKITGGTIISKSTNNNGAAVQNAGTLTIGVKDGNINSTSPYLISEKNTISNTGNNKFYFYDGVLYGKSSTISGKLSEMESNSTRNDTTEVISGVTYHKTYLS